MMNPGKTTVLTNAEFRLSRFCAVSGILVLVTAVRLAEASDAPSAQGSDRPAALAAIRENGERLRSGIYSAVGTLEHTPTQLGKHSAALTDQSPVMIEESIEGAFDHEEGKFHFSRLRNQIAGEKSVKFGMWTKSWIILRPENSIQARMNKSDGIASVSIATPVMPQTAPAFFQPVFDVRILGMTGVKGLKSSFDDLLRGFEETAFEEVSDGGKLVRLRADIPVGDTNYGERFEIWLDPAQGYQPIRYTVTQGVFTELETSDQLVTKSETSWIQIEGVWVPRTVELFSRSPEWDELLRLAFDWKSVNEPVQESWFTWEGLDLPDGSQVADTSIVNDVIVPVAIIGKSMERDTQHIAEGQHHERSWRMWILLLVNLIVVGVLLGRYLRRRIK